MTSVITPVDTKVLLLLGSGEGREKLVASNLKFPERILYFTKYIHIPDRMVFSQQSCKGGSIGLLVTIFM